jgi:hypothetical protein
MAFCGVGVSGAYETKRAARRGRPLLPWPPRKEVLLNELKLTGLI